MSYNDILEHLDDSFLGVMELIDLVHFQLFLISLGKLLYKQPGGLSAVLPDKNIYNSVVL